MKSSRALEKRPEDEIEANLSIAPIHFESIEDILLFMENLQLENYVGKTPVGAQGFKYKQLPALKETLVKLFPVDIFGRTYFTPSIDVLINTLDTGLLRSIRLKSKNPDKIIPAARYQEHQADLVYNEVLVELLISAIYFDPNNPKLADDEKPKPIELANIAHPTYTDRSLKKYRYQGRAELLRPPLAKAPADIRVLFPCGFASNQVSDSMLHYTMERNPAARSVIRLYYQSRIRHLLACEQNLPNIQDATEKRQALQTIHDLEDEKNLLEATLESLLNRLQKQHQSFRELSVHVDAAFESVPHYALMPLKDTRQKLINKERCTQRVTKTGYLAGNICAIAFFGAGLAGINDYIKHHSKAKEKLEYAKKLYEFRRLAAINGKDAIPHNVAQDHNVSLQDERRAQHIQGKIRKLLKRPHPQADHYKKFIEFGGVTTQSYSSYYPPTTLNPKEWVHFADIDNEFALRIDELKRELLLVRSVTATLNLLRNPQGTETHVSSSSASLHYHPLSASTSTSSLNQQDDASHHPKC